MAENPGLIVPAEQGLLLNSEPASWPESIAATGDAGVDKVLGLLASLPETETSDHPQQFEQLHDGLLSELESGPDEADSEDSRSDS